MFLNEDAFESGEGNDGYVRSTCGLFRREEPRVVGRRRFTIRPSDGTSVKIAKSSSPHDDVPGLRRLRHRGGRRFWS